VDPGARTLDAVVEQRPVLSNGLLVGLALAALLVVGLAVWLVRLPAVTGAGQRTVEPPTPTGVHMTGFSGGRASLAWKKNDYAWHRVDAFAGKPLPGAKPLQSVPVDPYRYFAVVALENVKPGALYCFQVTALDGDSASAPSTPVCDTTADAPLTPPKVPEPKLVPGGEALVTWNGDPSMTYQVVSTTGEGAPDGGVDTTVKGKSVVEVPVHAGLNCFTVTASKGRQKSRPSDPPSCAPPVDPQQVPSKDGNGNSGTARPSGSPGASPSPSQPSIRKVLDGWVVVLDQLPTAGADPAYQRARAARAVEALKRVGFTEADFQLVTPQKYAAFPEASFVAFAEVVQDQATAMADCQRLQKISAQKNSPFQEFSGCQVPLFVVPKSTP
jgi:hypothetical protein